MHVMFLLSSGPRVHYPVSRKTDPGNPWPEGLTGMRRNNTPPSQREWTFCTSILSSPSQINMTNRRKIMPGPLTTRKISMANHVSECIILPWSNQHDQSGRMYARCYSSMVARIVCQSLCNQVAFSYSKCELVVSMEIN
jgi:hypothetical protein